MSDQGNPPHTEQDRSVLPTQAEGSDRDTAPASQASSQPASQPARRARGDEDPLRGSRTSGIWAAVVALVVLLVLLAIFVLQNTQAVEVSFLGWTGHPPLAAALLIATAGGALVAVMAGALRLLQVRRRVRRQRKRAAA